VSVRILPLLVLAGLMFLLARAPVAPGQDKEKKPPEAPGQEKEKKPPADNDKQAEQKQPPPDVKEAYEELKEKAEKEYRLFFKRPETTFEFWAAIRFEIEDGKFDLAAYHLKQLLDKQPAEKVDDDLLTVEANEGLAPFTRLRLIAKWSADKAVQEDATQNVEKLIQRVTGALERRLGDRERINKLIKSLEGATAEERVYAQAQLKRSGARAAPMLVAALRNTAGTTKSQRLQTAIVRLGPEAIAPMFDVLRARDATDAKDVELRLALIDIFKRAGDTRAVPYLWHVAGAFQYPAVVRQRAKQALAYLLETHVERLTGGQVALTQLADNYYQNKVKFTDPKRVPVWNWDGKAIPEQPVVLAAAQADL